MNFIIKNMKIRIESSEFPLLIFKYIDRSKYD